MKRVLTAVVLAPLVLLAVFRAPLWLFALLVAAVIVLALHEYLHIAEAAGMKPFKRLTYIMGVAPFVSIFSVWPSERAYAKIAFSLLFLPHWVAVLMAAAVVFGVPLIFRKDLGMGLASAATPAFGLIYIGVSLSLLVCLRAETRILVVFVLFSVWAGDIAAYYVGRSIGKHKLAPVVSPNKSWEGAIASVIASVAVAALVLHFQPLIGRLFREASWFSPRQPSWVHIFSVGVITNVAAQLGDLFESALKRGANLKDSGTLLPGHGGVLDRIDALLFAIPVVWYYATLTGFLQPQTP
jgi:phosphatidate cytidylyltransferase